MGQYWRKKVWENKETKLLGLSINRDLTLTVISRIADFMSLGRRRILMKSFFESQFEYYSLSWRMFHNRILNNRINYLHYRALRIIYQNDMMSFNELLKKYGSVTIHHRNIQKLGI